VSRAVAGGFSPAATPPFGFLFLPGKKRKITDGPKLNIKPMLEIRIRMFLGLQDKDPDPLVRLRGADPDPDPSLFLKNACKIGF
jgi:hypothetical protein